MKPFDKAAAKRGAKVCTIQGGLHEYCVLIGKAHIAKLSLPY